MNEIIFFDLVLLVYLFGNGRFKSVMILIETISSCEEILAGTNPSKNPN